MRVEVVAHLGITNISMSTSEINFNIKPLVGQSNYDDWAAQMKLLFKAKRVDDFLEEPSPKKGASSSTQPIGGHIEGKTKESKDAEAQLLMLTLVSDPIKKDLMESYSAKLAPGEIWGYLEKTYESHAWDFQYGFVKEFMSLRAENFETLEQYLREYLRLANKIDEEMADTKILMLLINLEKIDQMKEWVDNQRSQIKRDDDACLSIELDEVIKSAIEKATFRGL